MYQVIENTHTATVNDFISAGITKNQIWKASRKGQLRIFRRGINGDTQIDINSVQLPNMITALENFLGSKIEVLDNKMDKMAQAIEKLSLTVQLLSEKVTIQPGASVSGTPAEPENKKPSVFPSVEIDLEARTWFLSHPPTGGWKDIDTVAKYTNRCSILNAIYDGLQSLKEARAKHGKKPNMGDFWDLAKEFYLEQSISFPCGVLINARSIERAFKGYFNGDKKNYDFIVNGNAGNDNTRKVSIKSEKLILALWIANNKPFKEEVHRLYMEFVTGKKEFFDKETGEVFSPEDFKYKPKKGGDPKPLEISLGTIWNYLKKHINDVATSTKRDGNYITTVEKMPYDFRKSPEYSLSKISMDDADLSRKMKGGDRVHRYMAYDVASGYWFTPVYSRTNLTTGDVVQCFRNMFCELSQMGLPMPGEIEHEHHLMDSIMTEDFKALFPFTTISSHSRNKRAEHAIRAVKWGIAHENNHTRGRFFGKDAYRTPRFKTKGEFKEKEFEFNQIVCDDLNDIDQHNNSLHPNQKTYSGMTRKEVFLSRINKNLPEIESCRLYQFIGNETHTSIYNNNHFQCNYEMYLLDDFKCLELLKPGNRNVTSYWLPDETGKVDKCYLYQEGKYIGSATNVENYRYNESKFEATEEDKENQLKQAKRRAKFNKMLKDTMSEVPVKLGITSQQTSSFVEEISSEIIDVIETPAQTDVNYEFDMNDIEKLAKEMC